MPIALISVDDLKRALGMQSCNDSEVDDELQEIIYDTSEDIEEYLNRKLKKEPRIFRTTSGEINTFLPAYPIDESETFSITVDGIVYEKDTDYFVWPDTGIVEFYFPDYPIEPKNITINYTGGYEETTSILSVPRGIRKAAKLQCMYEYQNKNRVGQKSVSYSDGSVTQFETGQFITRVKDILNKYRKITTGY